MSIERYTGSAPSEFMTIREIVNDVLHRLHAKDMDIIQRSSLHTLQTQYHEFSTHIRSFYSLHHPDNPLIKDQKHHPDEILDRILTGVWEGVNHSPYSS